MNDIWTYLKGASKPILLYGMGNGADKIIKVLNEYGIGYADTFASDGFVRGQMFYGKRVISYSEALQKYGEFIVLIAFGSQLPDVIDNVKKISSEQETYAPSVPVCGEELFSYEFYKAHTQELNIVRSLLSDKKSVEVFDEIIRYELDGKIEHLFEIETNQKSDMSELFPDSFTAYADLGAYTGDTLEAAFEFYKNIKCAIAFEPSVKSYGKIFKRLDKLGISVIDKGTAVTDTCNVICNNSTSKTVYAWNLASWDREEELNFADGSARNSVIGNINDKEKSGAKLKRICADTLDSRNIFSGEKLLIKYDVEGAEKQSLLGSVETIQKNDTSLIVSCYHRSEDLFELPLLIHKMLPKHQIYIRKHEGFPAWDINLYVTYTE